MSFLALYISKFDAVRIHGTGKKRALEAQFLIMGILLAFQQGRHADIPARLEVLQEKYVRTMRSMPWSELPHAFESQMYAFLNPGYCIMRKAFSNQIFPFL